MPSKSTMVTIAATLLALAVINNIPALGPVKKIVSGDSGWFG
jgi:hypothetical protein